MAALHDGDWELAEASPSSHRSQASGLVAAHLQWHLERQLRTLPLVERVYRVDRTVADRRVALVGQDEAHGNQRRGKETPTHSCLRRLTTIRPSRTSRRGRWCSPNCRPRPTAGSPVRRSTRRRRSAPQIPAGQVPNHVAVVMDGNGRWATQRGLGRTEGHKMGEAVLIDITCGAIEIGIKHLTRVRVLHRELEAQHRGGALPDGLQPRGGAPPPGEPQRDGRAHALGRVAAADVEQRHQGVRHRRADDRRQRRHHHQLLRELRRPHRDRRGGTGTRAGGGRRQDQPGRISEATFAKHLHRADIPDVDLFIRTSGEQRASNFLLWQAAYAEYVFQDKLWPDYDRRDLWAACEEYVNRNRRFGRA